MDILLLGIGKTTTPWIQDGLKEYEYRISRYIPLKSLYLPDLKNSKKLTTALQKEAEGKLLLKEITDADLVVLLDERGENYTSVKFSQWLQKSFATGKKRLVFIIGGPYGFSEEIYARANHKISLSQMTFTHEMARLFFTEQIYRALTILRGEPYHHE